MKKWFCYSVIFISFFLLVSCGVQEEKLTHAPASTQTETVALSATIAATPTTAPTSTSTRIPTKAATETPTVEPTPTETPYIGWNNTFHRVSFEGETDIMGPWAKTSNAFIYHQETHQVGDTLYKVSSPDFKPVALITKGGFERFTWSPDSQSILFTYDETGAQHLDVMDADGKNARELIPSIPSVHEVSIVGWLDPKNVLLADYGGGGHQIVDIVNIETGEISTWTAYLHGDIYPPQNGYIPAVSDDSNLSPNLLAIAQQFPKQSLDEGSEIGLGGNIRLMPEYQAIPRARTMSMIENWLPNSNTMLVSWQSINPATAQVQGPHLLLWDVNKNSVSLVAPNGKGGKYSPDGKYLAYLTNGPALVDQQSRPVVNKRVPAQPLPSYMQILDSTSGKVLLSLPVLERTDQTALAGSLLSRSDFAADFTKNGRYLAFLSQGKVQTNSDGWPKRVNSNDPSAVTVNLLDLQEKKLVWSAATNEKAEFSWSPTDGYLAYQDPELNWLLLNVQSLKPIPLTLENGSEAQHPDWSYDGSYLSFVSCPPREFAPPCHQTIDILDVTMTK